MRSAALPGALSVLKGQRRRRASGSGPGSPPPQIPTPTPSGRSSGAGRRGLDPRGSQRGRSGLAEGGMEGAAPANGEAADRGGANQSKDAEEAAANQQRDEELAVANGEALPQGSSSEGKRSCGSANEDTEPRELTNDSEEPQAANEDTGHKVTPNLDTGHKSLTNEDTEHKAPVNQDTGHNSPTNQNTTSPSTNQDTAPPAPTNKDTAPAATANENSPRQAPPNQDTPPQDPTNDLAPLPTAANQAPDPWDWSLEEAWLRTPEEEGLELWGAEPEGKEVDPEHQGVELESEWAELESEWAEPGAAAQPEAAAHWWSSPDGAWSKLIVRPGRGLARPGPGSRCRVLLTAPSCARWGPVSAASGSGRWRSVRLGSAEGRWSRLLDAALETMAGGELARIRVAAAAGAVTVTVQLGHFTAPPPFWASSSSSRWRSVTSGHARACALLAQGLLSAAGQAYSRALRAAILAGGPGPLSAEVSGVKAELHAGLALVQLRLGLPAAAAANAGKALALRPAHLEARYRRGVAQAAMMDLEAAMADLVAVLRAQPGHAGARRELRRVRGAARERDARLARRLGRLFA